MPSSSKENGDAPSAETSIPPALVAQAEAACAANEENEASSQDSSDHAHGARHQIKAKSTQQSQQDSLGRNMAGSAQERSGSSGTNKVPLPENEGHDPASAPVEAVPPPPYSESLDVLDINNEGLGTRAKVAQDGRVNINIQGSRRLSTLLVPALRSQMSLIEDPEKPDAHPPAYIPPSLAGEPGEAPPPPLNVVIQVVGSRGDVQPFVALGRTLKNSYGHRVRLATHPTFKQFVEENGLEFFSIGGDPAELMAFMVKNPGLMPGFESLRSGDVGNRRKGIYQIIKGCWRSCYETGDGTGMAPSEDYAEDNASFDSGISGMTDAATTPFVADAIIANPPSFAHIHIAEKLGIPLHIMFTMPWSPTQAFPHPLANIQSSNADSNISNFISYALVEMMTWQGLGDMINRFREKALNLEPVSLMWAPAQFLADGPPPVYIGFGSIVVDDPNAMTHMIFEAVKKAGVRALVSKGWGGLGVDELGVPEEVFMLGNVPHDWLFTHVSCVVHHGGAGTTAAGIALGKPTVVVPFFGDQPFWGAMIAKAGAGPPAIPYKNLTADSLAKSILEALKPAALEKAKELGAKIASEKGTENGAKCFHKQLDVEKLRCSLAPSRVAVWRVKRTQIRLSALSATVLANEGLLSFGDLKLYRPREYDSEDGPWDPISGAASALLGTLGSMMMGAADFPVEVLKAIFTKKDDDNQSRTSSDKERQRSGTTSPLGGSADQSRVSLTSNPEEARSRELTPTTSMTESMSNTEGLEALRTVSEPNDLAELGNALGNQSPTSPSSRKSNSLAQALREHPSRTKSGSRTSSPAAEIRRSLSENKTLETVVGTGKGVGRIVEAGLKSPMDFTLGLARGFHNAPKLYGDKTVRAPDRVTDFRSGLKTAGKEFGYSMFDGILGLVTHPIQGAKDEGAAGFVKGFGRGIGGVVLKPSAAVFALPGYTFKGIYKEIQKHYGSSVQNYIIAARTAQGYEDLKTVSQEESLDVVSRWHAIHVELEKTKQCPFEEKTHAFSGAMAKRCDSHREHREHRKLSKAKSHKQKHKAHDDEGSPLPGAHAIPQIIPPQDASSHGGENSFEPAIKASVEATSRGDPDEDRLIERAIRASVSELVSAREAKVSEEEALRRAIAASVRNHSGKQGGDDGDHASSPDSDNEHHRQVEDALRLSLAEHNHPGADQQRQHSNNDSAIDTDNEEEDPQTSVPTSAPKGVSTQQGTDEEHDEDLKLALQASLSNRTSAPEVDESELQAAIRASEEAHKRNEDEQAHQKTEEEIVLEYVKKQSLAEAEHRRKAAGGAEAAGELGESSGGAGAEQK
ncbi:MAG: hypothetical protein M1833_003682 [Piccolia ochrophora]|nr:MAG: hypothetical protein M1833_003682 [Piccolia ochrophora]